MRRAIQTHALGAARRQSLLVQRTAVNHVRSINSTAPVAATPSQQEFAGYYADLLDAPLRSKSPVSAGPLRTQPLGSEPPKSQEDDVVAKARVVFGSRLAGPIERKAAIDAVSRSIAGVLVPPKPEEPDNCCIGGCVNCVWVQYRCEMEDWAAKSVEARRKLKALRGQGVGAAMSMDDDGGPTADHEALLAGEEGKDMYEGIPVGIRAFMETEKMIREKQRLEMEASAVAMPSL